MMNRILKKSSQISTTRTLRRMRVDEDLVPMPGDNSQKVVDKNILLSQFGDEITALKKQAFDQAYADAKEQIQQELAQQYEQLAEELKEKFDKKNREADVLINRLSSLIQAAVDRRKNLVASQEAMAVYLALQVVYKLLESKEVYQAAIVKLIKDQLAEFVVKDAIRVRISPKDTEIEHLLPSEVSAHLKLITDPALPPGACEIEDGFSLIDVGVVTQLDQVREALVNKYKEIHDAI